MKKNYMKTALIATAISALMAGQAFAETVLNLDEVAVGELDPAKASDYADSILMFNVYDTLVLPNQGKPGVQPHLAKSWETDGKTYTFKLRDDVKFQSGNPFTAEDVVFSFNRSKALGKGLSYLFADVESAKALDDNTVQFTLKQPYSPFMASLLRLPILDKKTVMAHLGEGEGEMKDWGQAWLSNHSAGTGAYKVASHNPQQETLMEKSSAYFMPVATAAPDKVRLRYGLEPATVRALMSKGEHDITSQWLPPEVLKALANDGAQLLTEAGNSAFYFKMNTTKAPLDDVNCRKAFAAAYDYASTLQLAAVTKDVALGTPSTGLIPVGMYGANTTAPLQQDLNAAKEFLAKCKYNPADMDIEISWIAEVPLEERFALVMQATLNKLGVKSHIKKMPWALFTEAVSKPETTPHFSQLFNSAITGDPDTLLYGMYHSKNKGTWASPEYLEDAEVDKYLDLGRTETDPAKRQEAYAALNKRLDELAPSINGYDRQAVFAANERVKVPALTDPDKNFGLSGMGFTFRLMEVEDK